MDKAAVIYGQANGVLLDQVNWTTIQQAITAELGPEPVTGLNDAKKAVANAKKNQALNNPYIKVGLAGGDLVLRIKDKRTLLDKEIDTVLIRGYKAKLENYRKNLKKAENADLQEADSEVVKKMTIEFNSSIAAQLPNPTQVAAAKKAVEERDYQQAIVKVGGLAKKVRTGLNNLRKFDVFLSEICKSRNWDLRHVDQKKFSKKKAEVLAVLEKTEKIVSKLESETATIEHEQPAPATSNAGADQNYRNRFDLVLSTNQQIIRELQGILNQGNVLLQNAVSVAGQGERAKTADAAGEVTTAATQINSRFRSLLKVMIDTQYPMRHGLGNSATKQMTADDVKNVFSPLNTKSMNLTGKTIEVFRGVQAQLEPVLEDLAARFPEHRAVIAESLARLNDSLPERQ
jgi:hypothetical protein